MSNKFKNIPPELAVEIVDKSSSGFIVFNDRNEVVYTNQSWKEIIGCDPRENLETTREEMFPYPDQLREIAEMWKRDLTLENPPLREAQRQTRDGKKCWYMFQLSHLNNGYKMVRVLDITNRKILELKYSAIFQKAPDAVILHEAITGKIVEFNEKALKLFGYTRKELSGTSIYDVVVSIPADQIMRRVEDVVRKPHDYFESSVKRKNGEIRHVSVSTTTIESEPKTMVQAIIHDITDRKLAEGALKESELRLQKIIEQSPISMAIVSMTGIIEYINKKAVETFGFPHEDIPTMDHWWLLAYPDKKYRQEVITTWTGLVEKAIRDQREIEGREYKVTCKNGSTRIVLIFGVPVENKVFVMFEDITARKLAEASLKESEEMFRNLAEQSPNMIFINKDRRVVYANEQCETIMGYTQAEICSADFNFMCLIAPESHSLINQSWARHTKGEESPSYEYDLITKKGKRIHAVIATKLIHYGGQRAVLGIVTDISEIKKIQNELKISSITLNEQKKALQQKNTALKEILAQIETEKLEFKKQVSINVEKLLLPSLKRIRTQINSHNKRYIDVLESNIKELVSSFGLKLSSGPACLSPRELEICNMIKTGLASKEISEILHVSLRTVETHRNRIRRKLCINARDINLSSHLQNLT